MWAEGDNPQLRGLLDDKGVALCNIARVEGEGQLLYWYPWHCVLGWGCMAWRRSRGRGYSAERWEYVVCASHCPLVLGLWRNGPPNAGCLALWGCGACPCPWPAYIHHTCISRAVILLPAAHRLLWSMPCTQGVPVGPSTGRGSIQLHYCGAKAEAPRCVGQSVAQLRVLQQLRGAAGTWVQVPGQRRGKLWWQWGRVGAGREGT